MTPSEFNTWLKGIEEVSGMVDLDDSLWTAIWKRVREEGDIMVKEAATLAKVSTIIPTKYP